MNINTYKFIEYINKYFPKPKVIMEIGSMDGTDAILLKSAFPESTVYCIEGLPDNFNTYIKDLKDLVPINCVVSNIEGIVTYYMKNINGIHGIYDRGSNYGTKTLELNSKRLVTLCKEYNIKELEVLKIDVEGATLDILYSMDSLLNTIKIMHIETETIEYFKGQTLEKKVFAFLEKNNFKLIDIQGTSIGQGTQNDSVWVHT